MLCRVSFLFAIGIFFASHPLFSQSPALVIKEIFISGNHKTKTFIITRELDIQAGDTLQGSELNGRLEKNRNRIFNTRLFNHVEIFSKAEGQDLLIEVRVIEKWYIWPYPVIQFADRNFNIWWESKDLSRLNYGMNIHHYNFRGRGEILKLRILGGYTHSFGLDYEIPYIDREKKRGIQLTTSYHDNKEVWYKTENNRLKFFFDPASRAIRAVNADLAYIYRPRLYFRHIVSAGFEKVMVKDVVLTDAVNPGFLYDGRNSQTSLKLWYTFKWDRRDIAYYPLRGHFMEVNAEPRYLLESKKVYAQLRWNAEKFWQLGKNVFAGAGWRGKVSGPSNQPYNLVQSLGYKFFVRGFEPYVVDGQVYNLLQTNLKYRLLNGNFDLPLIQMSQFKKVPYAVYATVFADGAYVHATGQFKTNSYQNSGLSGYGVGLDFVTYYDRVMRLEYAVNNFGLGGLYLHFTAPI